MCKNMTNALKANKILYNNGIYSKVEKLTEYKETSGCVYAVSFEDKYFEDAVELMYKANVVLHKSEKNYYGDSGL